MQQSWNRACVSAELLLSSSKENLHLLQMEEVLHQNTMGCISVLYEDPEYFDDIMSMLCPIGDLGKAKNK
jgi:hypothetical protein